MNPSGIVRFTALYIAAVFSILLTGGMLIAHEISEQFRQVLVSLTGHHWITVSILSALIFIALLFTFAFATRSRRIASVLKADRPFLWSVLLVISTALMTGVILTMYILHYNA